MKLATGEEPEGHEGSERRRLWRQAVIEARVQRTRAIACQVILCTSIALSIALSADTRWCRQRSHLTQQSDDVEAALGLLQGLHPSPAVVEKRPALAVTSASLVRLDESDLLCIGGLALQALAVPSRSLSFSLRVSVELS